VAKRRKRRTSWLKALLFFTVTPFVVWALAFLVWLYWYDITGLFGPSDNIPAAKTSKEIERSTQPSEKSPQEGIREEDRKKLEEILKSKR
jgi:hypothetical protein